MAENDNDNNGNGNPQGPSQNDLDRFNALIDQQRTFNTEVERNYAISQKQRKLEEEIARLRAEQTDFWESAASATQKSLDSQRKEVEGLKEKLALAAATGQITAENLKLGAEKIQELEEEFALREQILSSQQNLSNSTSNLLGTTLGIRPGLASVESLFGSASQGGAALLSSVVGIAEGIGDVLDPVNIIANVIQAIGVNSLNAVRSLDAGLASLNRQTQAAGELRDNVVAVREANTNLGVDYEMSAAAIGALESSMSNFLYVSDEAQDSMGDFAAKMEFAGVSAADSGVLLGNFTKTLGYTNEESASIAEEFVRLGKASKIPANELIQGLNQALPQLAVYGKRAPEIFMKVQKTAKGLGLEVGSLLGITGQFDTFEGAADAAGKLNAVLGGNLLDSTQLLLATEDERVDMLREAVAATGRSFDSMGKFEKKAIAASLGITDMNEAARLFGEDESFSGQVESSEEYQEMLKQSLTLMDKLSAIMKKMAASTEGLFEVLNDVADFFIDNTKTAIGLLIVLGGTIAILGKRLAASLGKRLLGKVRSSLVGEIKGIVQDVSGMAPSPEDGLPRSDAPDAPDRRRPSPAPGTRSPDVPGQPGEQPAPAQQEGFIDKLSKLKPKQLWAIGGAIMLIGAGVGLAAYGMSLLVESFAALGDNTEAINAALIAMGIVMVGMIGMMAVFGFTVTALGAAGLAAWPGLLAVGGAIALMGLGVGIAAAGMSLLVESFAKLKPNQITAMAGAFMQFAAAILLLTVSLAGLAALAMAAPLLAVGFLALVGLSATIVGVMSGIKDVVNELDTAKLTGTFNLMTATTTAIQTAEGADSADIEKLKEVVEVSQNYVDMRMQNEVAGEDSLNELIVAIKSLGGAAVSGANMASDMRPIEVRIDLTKNNHFKKAVEGVVGKKVAKSIGG
jgi:MFS family permease